MLADGTLASLGIRTAARAVGGRAQRPRTFSSASTPGDLGATEAIAFCAMVLMVDATSTPIPRVAL